MEASLGSVMGTTTSELASVPKAVVDMGISPSVIVVAAIAPSVDEGIGPGLSSVVAGSVPVDIPLPSDAIIVGRSRDMYAVLEAAISSVVVAAGIPSAGMEVMSDAIGAASVMVELVPSDVAL